MKVNEIREQARHETAELILSGLMDAGAVKIEADKVYAIPHEIDSQTVWTEITISTKKDGYNPREKAKEIEAKKKAKKV